jgi:TRAP-type mannitol/chloroaromatic compound transport system permease small subunit
VRALRRFLRGILTTTLAALKWLVLPLGLLLFLQWPLREFVHGYSREANDLGQWIFALYVSLAMTFATRERTHLAVDAIAHGYSARLRDLIARWGGFVCVAPWAVFMIWSVWPTVQRSVSVLEKFPETFNFGYFLIKIAALLLAVLALIQSILDLRRPAH